MATFHINRSGTNLGTFSEDEVRDGLRSGKFAGTDLGWREGMATWQPLAQISEFVQETGPGAASPPPQFAGGAVPPGATVVRARVCRGMIGNKKDFSPRLWKLCKWC